MGRCLPDPLAPEDAGFTYDVLEREGAHRAGEHRARHAGRRVAGGPAERERAVMAVVRGVDRAVSGLPPGVQEEVAQLFALLGFPLTRRLLAGVGEPVGWRQVPMRSGRFLERWRASSFALLRSAYAALHELIMAAWYGNPVAWPAHRLSRPAGCRCELKLRTTALNRRGAEAQSTTRRHACASKMSSDARSGSGSNERSIFVLRGFPAPPRLCGERGSERMQRT